MSQPLDRSLPVVVTLAYEERRSRPRASRRPVEGIHEAHIYGQTGARRGLRGGRYAIDQAHSAYLNAEWSGSADRRREMGGFAESEI